VPDYNAIQSLISQGEGQSIEFKTTFQKEAIETVVAFANAKGGKIFIGVSDTGDILGIKLGNEQLQNWINQIKQNTSPSVIPDMSTVEIKGEKIVIIDVKEYPIKPISYKNRYILRRSNSNHIMSMEEIANEYLKTKNSSWDHYADNAHDFNDISLDKVEYFINKIEKRFARSFDDNPMEVLQKYGLLRNDQLTFGAYLLFAKGFCLTSGIQAGRFKTSTDIIDSISLNTDILSEIDAIMIFVQKHLSVEYIITGEAQREERYDYPLDAIREVVLNMVVHRDYRDSSDSVIKIFDDRIEFFNPGGLYDDLTIEQLTSNYYQSKTRNKLVAHMFKECGLIEKYGSGISRIKKQCAEHGLIEPKFEEIQKGFQVTLYKAFQLNVGANVGVNVGVNVGANVGVNEVLEFIKQNQPTKSKYIVEYFDVTQRTIERYLKQLKDSGKIEFKGATKTGGYYVK
jgi:ATP-dependent DNA helicase RecG